MRVPSYHICAMPSRALGRLRDVLSRGEAPLAGSLVGIRRLDLRCLASGPARTVAVELEQGARAVPADEGHIDAASALVDFAPDLVYLRRSTANLRLVFCADRTEQEFEAGIAQQLARLREVWNAIWAHLPCQIIQNTFDPPALRPLGHLDASSFGSVVNGSPA